MTKSGRSRPIKWIGRRSYSGRFVIGRKDILPVCIKAGALADNVPRRDLWISPLHAMYLDGVLIEAKDLINGVSIVQAERVEKVEYFHIELDSHDVIIAEGALSESFIDDDSRNMFHNAHEFRALYPAAATEFAHYCAPRLYDGYAVEAARQRLVLRAGLSASQTSRASACFAATRPRRRRAASKAGRRTRTTRKRRCASTSTPAAACWVRFSANNYRERSPARRPRQWPSQLCLHAAGGPRLCARCGWKSAARSTVPCCHVEIESRRAPQPSTPAQRCFQGAGLPL